MNQIKQNPDCLRLASRISKGSQLYAAQAALRALFIVVLLAIASPLALAASGGQQSIGSQINRIQQQINSLQNQKGKLSADEKQRLSVLQKALTAYQSAASYQKKTNQLADETQNASAQISKYKAKTQQLKSKIQKSGVGQSISRNGQTADELASQVSSLAAQLKSDKSELNNVRDRLSKLANNPSHARHELQKLRAQRQQQKQANHAAVPGGNASQPSEGSAQDMLTEAKKAENAAHIQYLEKDLSTVETRKNIANAKRVWLQTKVSATNKKLATIESQLNAKRKNSAKNLEKEAEASLNALRTARPLLQNVSQKNVEMAQSLLSRVKQNDSLSQQRVQERDRLDSLQQRLNLVNQQLSIGAGSTELGDLLRHQQRQLPAKGTGGAETGIKQVNDLASVQLKNFQLSQEARDLSSLDERADTLTQSAGVTLSHDERQTLIQQLKLRREIVQRLQSATSDYVETGRELRQLSKQLTTTLSSFRQLLNQRLFWLPSSHPIDWSWFARIGSDVPRFMAPAHWGDVISALGLGLMHDPIRSGFGALFLLALLMVSYWLEPRLAVLAKPVGRVGDDTMWLTLQALGITVLLSLRVPLLLMGIYALLIDGSQPGSFAQAVGKSLFGLAMLVMYLGFFINVSREDGLADAHFKWPTAARRTLLRSLLWLLGLLLVPSFIIVMVNNLNVDALRETLGRAGFMLSSLVLAFFAFRMFLPRKGVLSHVFAPNARTWRGGYFWLPLGAVVPITLAGLAACGYFYTALQLQSRFFYSIALVGGATVIYGIVVRWLTVVVRRMALRQARQRRQEAREARAAREQGGEELPQHTSDELEISLPQIGDQTRSLIDLVLFLLVGAMLWLIWANTVSALSLLSHITLWHNTTQIKGHAETINITLGALLLSLIVGLGTAWAGRNLPGFLEITVLQRFSMTPGSRYAVSTLFKYAIVILGLFVAVTLVGFHWSSIQWLVAALGVGLGFGLQAIFANFISGLIILFERPVRVGDVVSVGNIDGFITRVRIRATTMLDWDNKEVIIPNQTFITQTVTNWTLSDDIARMVITVRVDYESDTQKVAQLIRDVIEAQPQVLDDPGPSVYLVDMDHSGLVFNGRVYYRDPYTAWMPLLHALYTGINEAFAGQDVRISFDQRDLHLRSMDESLAGVFSSNRSPGGQHEDDVSSLSDKGGQ